MYLREICLFTVALCFGLIAAGGVFTVFVTVGLIPRFAGKTETRAHIMTYEGMVSLGTVGGCIFSVFYRVCEFGPYLLAVGIPHSIWRYAAGILLFLFGIFAGMFEGCFAIAIAEMLNTIPIFARRVGFRKGLGISIFMIALGKTAGSFFYFINQIYRYGGV